MSRRALVRRSGGPCLALFLLLSTPAAQAAGAPAAEQPPLRADSARLTFALRGDAAGLATLARLRAQRDAEVHPLGEGIFEMKVAPGTARAAVSLLRSTRGVAWAEPMLSGDGGRKAYPTGRVIVSLRPTTAPADGRALDDHARLAQSLERWGLGPALQRFGLHGGRPVLSSPRHEAWVFELPTERELDAEQIAAELEKRPGVLFAQPDLFHPHFLASPDDPYYDDQWALENTGSNSGPVSGTSGADVDAPGAWGLTLGDDDVVVAVIDTGVDKDHPDLAGRLVTGFDFTTGSPPEGVGGNAACSTSASSDAPHGTSVAGIIAAVQDNAEGISGLAPASKLMSLRISPSSGSASAQAAAAIEYAWENGAAVINGSWVLSSEDEAVEAALVDAYQLGRGGLGTALVFGSGNGNVEGVAYPARLDYVLAVGGSSPCDERKSDTSCDAWVGNYPGANYGEELDLIAPSVYLTTLDHSGVDGSSNPCGWHSSRFTVDITGKYALDWAGTSGATPHASAAAALLIAFEPNLPVDAVYGHLMLGAADQVGPTPDPAGWDEEKGWGRLDAGAALDALDNQDLGDLYVDQGHAGPEIGSSSHPFDTVAEALALLDDGGDVTFEADTYDAESISLGSKPMVLKARNGSAIFQ